MTKDELNTWLWILRNRLRIAWKAEHNTAQRTWKLQINIDDHWTDVLEGDEYGESLDP